MNTKQRFDAPLKIKAVNDAGEFEGYGSIFGNQDSVDDVVMPGAFQGSLARWQQQERLPAMLWQHDMHEPIGIYTEMREDDQGLYVKGRLLVDDDPLAKRAHAHMKAGSLTGLSIGYMLKEWDFDRDKDVFLIKEVDLWEVSLVTFPANDEARISNVKSFLERGELPRPSEFEKALREVGLSRSQAKGFMASGYSAIQPRDAEAEAALSNLKSLMDYMK